MAVMQKCHDNNVSYESAPLFHSELHLIPVLASRCNYQSQFPKLKVRPVRMIVTERPPTSAQECVFLVFVSHDHVRRMSFVRSGCKLLPHSVQIRLQISIRLQLQLQ